MDLKQINGELCPHLIDHATRFSVAVRVSSKHKEVIVDKIMTNWITMFGKPQQFLVDNGGEFNNSLMVELSDCLGTEVLSTSSESPWSNGITEKHNALIGSMATKVIDETGVSLDVALAWSASAKNSLIMCMGSHQISSFLVANLISLFL